jgi:3-hydroxymyristoyl/3-hydroxydecanoyl-(acyl carrier protein) dehydratase
VTDGGPDVTDGGADAMAGGQEVRRAALRIRADHAAYAGHFPGFPILPGAVLLDEVLHEIADSRGLDLRHWKVASAKFSSAVRPGDALTVEHAATGSAAIRFLIRCSSGTVASGTLTHGA